VAGYNNSSSFEVWQRLSLSFLSFDKYKKAIDLSMPIYWQAQNQNQRSRLLRDQDTLNRTSDRIANAQACSGSAKSQSRLARAC
jgi:hypothetical protein